MVDEIEEYEAELKEFMSSCPNDTEQNADFQDIIDGMKEIAELLIEELYEDNPRKLPQKTN